MRHTVCPREQLQVGGGKEARRRAHAFAFLLTRSAVTHRSLWEEVVLGPDAAEHNWGSSCLGDLGAGSTDMDVPPLSQLYKENHFLHLRGGEKQRLRWAAPCPLLLFPRLDLTASLGPVLVIFGCMELLMSSEQKLP